MCCHKLSIGIECCIYLLSVLTSWKKGILPCAPLIKSLFLCWPLGASLPFSHPWEGQGCPVQCAICQEEASHGQNSAGKVAFGPGFAAELSFISSVAASWPGSSELLNQQRASLTESVSAAGGLGPAAAIKALSVATLCRWKWRSQDDFKNKPFLPRKARDGRLAK